MVRKYFAVILIVFLLLGANRSFAQEASMADVQSFLMRIRWLGQSTLVIKAGRQVLIFDPWQIINESPADIIFVTHSHYDHLSKNDIDLVKKKKTVIVTNSETAAKLPEHYNIKTVKVGDKLTINDIPIEVVPAYNLTKEYHPQANGWCGFIVTIDGVRVYIAGDTDFIPEMKEIKADIAILPIGGTYTMDVPEALEAAAAIKPKVAIPYHYGKVVGSDDDARTFNRKHRGMVRILRVSR